MRMWRRLIATALIAGTITLGAGAGLAMLAMISMPAKAHIPYECADKMIAYGEIRKVLADYVTEFSLSEEKNWEEYGWKLDAALTFYFGASLDLTNCVFPQ